jgi:cation:H+ antiporter
MSVAIPLIIGGLILLALGAEGLIRGSAAIAIRLGITPLVIGLTVVAFGTGSPELFVCLDAALGGNSSIALGNIVGSNISNIALILGIAALVRPIHVRAEVVKREVPVMIAASVLFAVLLYDGTLGRVDGVILVICGVAYTVTTYLAAKRNRQLSVEKEFAEAIPKATRSPLVDFVFIVLGLAALLLGAKLLVGGAVTIAERFGISKVAIGLTIIAIGTSLPELATSVVATFKKEPDIALGNAVGSNILNIFFILGLTALAQPIRVFELRALDVGVMIGCAVVVLPLLWRGSILNRWEGVLLLAGYGCYLYTLRP